MVQERLTKNSTPRLERMKGRLDSNLAIEKEDFLGVLDVLQEVNRTGLAELGLELARDLPEAATRLVKLRNRREAIDWILTRRGTVGGGNV